MPNYEHKTQSKNYIKTSRLSRKKYATEPAKVHLNSVMETIRNHSNMKNIGQTKNFQRNTIGSKNLKYIFLSKISGTISHFKKMPTNKKNRYLLFMFKR